MHSETPGLMIDRLSILALKIFHTREETRRESATEAIGCGIGADWLCWRNSARIWLGAWMRCGRRCFEGRDGLSFIGR